MGLITVPQVVNDTEADAPDINVPVNTIVSEINGQLDNSNIDAAAGISTTKLGTDGFLAAWAPWSPIFTNLTVGAGTLIARFVQTGKTVHFRLSLAFGVDTAVTGTVLVTLPVPTAASYIIPQKIADAVYYDVGNVTHYGLARWVNAQQVEPIVFDGGGTGVGGWVSTGFMAQTVPFAWGSTDVLTLDGTYERA